MLRFVNADAPVAPAVHLGAGPLLLIAAAGIALLLVLIIRVKVPAFLALLLVSVAVAIASTIKLGDVFTVVTSGVGATMGKVALLIGLGAVLGRLIEASGGVQALADHFTRAAGPQRVAMALMAVAFLVAIPVFFEVAVIVLIPVIYAFSALLRQHPIRYGLPMCGLMLAIHVAVPPHPGIVAGAGVFGSDLGMIMMIAIPICVPLAFLSYVVANRMTGGRTFALAKDVADQLAELGHEPADVHHAKRATPGPGVVIGLIAGPILLIMIGTIGTMNLPKGTFLYGLAALLGTPAFALLLAVTAAFFIIKSICGWTVTEAADLVESGLPPVGSILMVVAAGGVFGAVLGASGIGAALASTLKGLGLPVILMAFIVSLCLRAAQGSATVAIVTTAGLLSTAVASGGYSPLQVALLTTAVGFGSLGLSHVTDAGFWVVVKYLGLSVSDGLRTWTVLTTVLGVAGFLLTWLVWILASALG